MTNREALEVIERFGVDSRGYPKLKEALDMAIEALSAQPERKGEWVNARDGYDGHVKCNKCFKTYDWTSDAQYFNFCPNCGADMKSLPKRVWDGNTMYFQDEDKQGWTGYGV